MIYYGIHDPASVRDSPKYAPPPNVFQNKLEALAIMKQQGGKEVRMRAFNTHAAAADFSRSGICAQPSAAAASGAAAADGSPLVVSRPQLQQQEPAQSATLAEAGQGNGGESSNGFGNSNGGSAAATASGSLPSAAATAAGPIEVAAEAAESSAAATVSSPTVSVVFVVPANKPLSTAAATTNGSDKPAYRGPKSQELVQFRKLIEQSKYELVRDTCWKNPRYLIGSGDTPTLLKESCRYNALHVAALAQNARMCQLLLDTIGDPQFVQLLYGKKNAHHCSETSGILQDLYLNMPERGRNETPLHLAAKFGALEVVDVLTSYAQCQSRPNSDGLLPIDIVCSRVERDWTYINEIKAFLNGRFYVPVIRSVDNSLPPMIGEPFSPKNPPRLQFDPLSPEMEIQAYAGPMNREEAHTFRRRWKTPPRTAAANSSLNLSGSGASQTPFNLSLFNSPNAKQQPTVAAAGAQQSTTPGAANRFAPAKVSTPEATTNGGGGGGVRQLFRNGAAAAELLPHKRIVFGDDAQPEETELLIPVDCEDADLVGDSVSPPSPVAAPAFRFYRCANPVLDDSLAALQNTSTGSNNSSCATDSPMFRERHAKLCDSGKGLEVIGRGLASQRRIKWREYWPFLESFVDIRSAEGLLAFEERLAQTADARLKAAEELGAAREAAEKGAAAGTGATGGGAQSMIASLKESGISLLCKALNQLEVKGAFSADGQLPNAPPPALTAAAAAAEAAGVPQMQTPPPKQQQQQQHPPVLAYNAQRRIVQQTQPPPHASSFSAYLCAEKSFQVYAKRVVDSLRCTSITVGIREQLAAELRRLRSLVCSCHADERFAAVDFGQAHSRFAHLVVAGLVAPASEFTCDDLRRLRGECRLAHSAVVATNSPANGPAANAADDDMQCVLANVLHYLAGGDGDGGGGFGRRVRQPRSAGLQESGARQLWATEERCRCVWSATTAGEDGHLRTGGSGSGGRFQHKQQRHLKRMSQRMELKEQQQQQQKQEAERRDAEATTVTTSNGKINGSGGGWQSHRRSGRREEDDDDDDDDDADDEYLSDSDSDGSDDDVYLTPPETMSPCTPGIDDLELSAVAAGSAFNNYAMGEEPTKTDVDVLNALAEIDVDPALYPHVSQWRDAMQRYSAVERNAFLSLTPLPASATQNRCRTSSKVSATLPVKTLFRSAFKPIALPPPPTTTTTTPNKSYTTTTNTPSKLTATNTANTATSSASVTPNAKALTAAALETLQSAISSALTLSGGSGSSNANSSVAQRPQLPLPPTANGTATNTTSNNGNTGTNSSNLTASASTTNPNAQQPAAAVKAPPAAAAAANGNHTNGGGGGGGQMLPPPLPPLAAHPTRSPARSTLGFLPKLGAKLQQLNRDILRPSAFVPSAGANSRPFAADSAATVVTTTSSSGASSASDPVADGGGDVVVAISPKFAMTPQRKPPPAHVK